MSGSFFSGFQRGRNRQWTFLKKIGKFLIQTFNCFIGKGFLQPKHELITNPAIGMKIAVEFYDFLQCDGLTSSVTLNR